MTPSRPSLHPVHRIRHQLYGILLLAIMPWSGQSAHAADWYLPGHRLPASGGVASLEGAAGGGLVPWAVISGYGTQNQIGGHAFHTDVGIEDFTLSSTGLAIGFFNRLELSYAQQRLGLGSTVPGEVIHVDTAGLKLRLAGDAIYDERPWMPQLALGLQYKKNQDFTVPALLGAKDDHGSDIYLAATKLWLAGPLGRSLVANVSLRATRANQLGILGFGGDENDGYRLMPEASLALLLHDRLALGIEYRDKPDNLGAFHESSFNDVFMAWFPHKAVSLTAAYADLGNIADKADQHGFYLSMQINH